MFIVHQQMPLTCLPIMKQVSLFRQKSFVTRIPLPPWYQAIWSTRVLRAGANFALFTLDPNQFWSFACLRKIRQDFRELKPDIIVTTSPPHSIHRIGAILQQQWQKPWVMDLRDTWIENNTVRWYTPLHKFISSQQYRRCAQNAAKIVANTQEMARLISTRFPEKSADVVTIRNGYDEYLYQQANSKRPAGCDDGTYVILYSGSTYDGWATNILAQLGEELQLRQNAHAQVQIYAIGEMTNTAAPKPAWPTRTGSP